MRPFKYYDFMRICKDTKYLRLKLVQFARQEGVKAAARAFGRSSKTWACPHTSTPRAMLPPARYTSDTPTS